MKLTLEKRLFSGCIVLLIFIGCERYNEPENGDRYQMDVPSTTQVMDTADWELFFKRLVKRDSTIYLDAAVKESFAFQAEDVVVAPYGEGLIRKIISIEEDKDQVILTTEPATLAEAAPSGEVHFSVNMNRETGPPEIIYLADGVEFTPESRLKESEVSFGFTIKKQLHPRVSLEGTLSIDPTFNLDMKWDNKVCEYLLLGYNIFQDLELKVTSEIAKLEYKKEYKLIEVKFPTITIPTPVPIFITPELQINVGGEFALTSEVTTGIYQSMGSNIVFEYNKGDAGVRHDLDFELTPLPPELNNTLSAKAYVKPQISMIFYGSVAPNISMELYALLEGSFPGDPLWSLYGGLGSYLGISFEVFGFEIASFEANIFDERKLIASSDNMDNYPPKSAFIVNPPNGTEDTWFLFDPIYSSDVEDDSLDLQMRWDWNGDDQWDTGYAPVDTISHQFSQEGIQKVALEIKDTDGGTGRSLKKIVIDNEGMGGPCQGMPYVVHGNKVYPTIQIGEQCWLRNNLDIGEMIPSNQAPADNGIIEKFCYDNDPDNCAEYGGLYSWDEMMQYVDLYGTQGICPDGWHVPTDNEWCKLEGFVDSKYPYNDVEWRRLSGRGWDAGMALKEVGYRHWDEGNDQATNESGFTALASGFLNWPDNRFGYKGQYGYFWTSDYNGGNMGYYHYQMDGGRFAGKHMINLKMGLPVRCIRDAGD